MNKFSVLIFIIVIAVFGGIILATQKTVPAQSNTVPSLPQGAMDLNLITPMLRQPEGSEGQQQGAQGVQGAQSQQQMQAAPKVLPTFGVEEPTKASYSAVIKTSKGDIHLTLYGTEAPRTVKNFIAKAKTAYYKNLTFHRVEDWVIQGGDPAGNGTGGGVMKTETNSKPFKTGSLGVARGGDVNISNDSQFFITKTDASHLDRQYTNFGEVTEGMDVVNKIQIGDKILQITVE